MKPIGIDIPITRGAQGLFKQTFSTTEAIRSNILNILLTNNGERPLNPAFGLNLNKFIFEQDLEIRSELMRDEIKSIIGRYEPSVNVESVRLQMGEQNSVQVSLDISLARYPNFFDTLVFNLNLG